MSPHHTPDASHITGWVLAGGQGARMGGVDKGLMPFQGQTLAERAIARLRPQVSGVMVNANRHLETYRSFGVAVVPDDDPTCPGPLAGFLTGLHHCPTEWLVTVPCDSPFFPTDLVPRLAHTATENQAQLVMAMASQNNVLGQSEWRLQPVFCLMHRQLADGLAAHLRTGRFKIAEWAQQQSMAVCRFETPDTDALAFANANTEEELARLASLA